MGCNIYKYWNYCNYRNMIKTAKNIPEKCNRYFTSIPINTRAHAMLLASEVCWDIIEVLRETGVRGLTAKEIQHKLKMKGYPQSTIYSALSQLEKAEWIQSRRSTLPWGRPPKEVERRLGRDKAKGGRPRKLYHANILWMFEMDEDFAETLHVVMEKHIPELKEIWIKMLSEIVKEFKNNSDLQKFFPKDTICPDCDISHEGLEFLRAISYELVHLIEDEDEWDEFAKKNGFMK